MIAMTSKAAKRFKLSYKDLQPTQSGAWVVDLIKLGKGPLLVIIVHQDSLFTLIRQSGDVKTIDDITCEIAQVWPVVVPEASTTMYKNANRRVTGSITDMKHMIRVHARFDNLRKIEDRMNDCPFSAIVMDHPRKRFAKIRFPGSRQT